MTTTPGFLSTTELDFQSYKESLKTFLRQQNTFKDFDFEGSNLSVLIDVLAYNTYMNGTYLNLIGSEMFLDTALQRESIISHAKELNYTPHGRTSSRAVVTLSVTGTNLPTVLVVPKGYKITGKSSDSAKSFSFVTDDIVTLNASDGHAADIEIFEGKIINETFLASAPHFALSSENVDLESIVVYIQNSASDTTTTEWQRATTLFGQNEESKVFFVQGYEDYRYEIVFGNNVVGAALTPGNLVRVSYRMTNGPDANGIKKFSTEQSIGSVNNKIAIALADSAAPSFGGAWHETDAAIKFNAPKYFATQERAVTSQDYITLLRTKFPTLEAVTAYGGEDAVPKQYSKVIISGKTSGSQLLSNTLKTAIVAFLKDKTSLGIDPIVVDPEFFFVGVDSAVAYDLSVTTKSAAEIEDTVSAAVVSFSAAALDNFGSDLRYSRLLRAIDDADVSIVSNDTTVTMIKKLYPEVNVATSYAINFGNKLRADGVSRLAYTDAQTPVVTSSVFDYVIGGNRYDGVFIRDTGDGFLAIYATNLDGSLTALQKIGTVDYESGTVLIHNLIISGIATSGLFKISAKIDEADIITNNNKILLIEQEDIRVVASGARR